MIIMMIVMMIVVVLLPYYDVVVGFCYYFMTLSGMIKKLKYFHKKCYENRKTRIKIIIITIKPIFRRNILMYITKRWYQKKKKVKKLIIS